MQKDSIAQAAALVTILTVASKISGFIREQIVAGYFGASNLSDAFVAAQTMPVILSGVVLAGIGTAFLPVFSEHRASGRAWPLSDTVFTLTGLIALAIATGGVVAAPALVRVMYPGFSGETLRLAITMTRIIFPSIVFGALAIPARAVLNSFHHFATPTAAPLAQNVAAIAGLVALAGLAGFGVTGLAIGWAAGAVVALAIQIPPLRRAGARVRLRLDLRDPGIRKTFILAAPLIVGAVVSQGCVLVDRGLASGLPAGSISALNFADKLRQLPLAIFATAVVTVIYPTLSEMANRRDYDGLKEALGTGLRLISLLVLPAAFGLGILRLPLVRLMFERGAFDAADTAATSAALLYYCIGMIGLALTQVLSTALYAVRDMVTPVIISAIGVGVNIALDFALVRGYAHAGIALANSVASVLTAVLMLVALRRRLGPAGYAKTAIAVGKMTIASLAMATAVGFAARAGFIQPTQPFRTQVLAAAALMCGGVAVYVVMIVLLRVDEARTIWRRVRRFLPISRA